MKKQLLLILSLAFIAQNLFAQKQSRNWYFGDYAAISFDSIAPPTALTTSAMTNGEGVASISDYYGNLLFYTNGISVFDSSNQQMPNGSGLLGNSSSTQSSIIVRKPSSDSLYYIFTVDYLGGTDGLQYSIVNMSLNGGKGDVSSKNNLIHGNSREKVTAIRHANKVDFWVLVIDWATDDIYSYLVDSSGVNLTPVISPMDSLHMQVTTPSINRANGYMKANRQGNRIAMGLWAANSFDVFDFDDNSGVVSNHIKIQGNSTTMKNTYGVEFSPDGTILYGTTMSPPFKIIQFDLSHVNGDSIFAHRTVVASQAGSLCSNYYYGALQIAPDGKIYSTTECDSFLNVINSPDSLGISCNYVGSAVSLNGKQGKLGLPNFIADYALPIVTNKNFAQSKNVNIKIYPNPSQGELNISVDELNNKEASFILTDLLGRKLEESTIVSENTTLTIEQANGIYFASILIDEIIYTRKIIIQR